MGSTAKRPYAEIAIQIEQALTRFKKEQRQRQASHTDGGGRPR